MRRFSTLMAATLTAGCLFSIPCLAERVATARIEVKGAILPPACSIVLDQGGVIDYGAISLLAIPNDRPLRLARKTFPISLNCADPVQMRLKVRDERAGTAVPGILSPADDMYLFGLGEVAGKKLGAFKLSLDPASFRGLRPASRAQEELTLLYAFSNNVWQVATGGHFRANGTTQMSFARRGRTTPSSYLTVSGTAMVEAWLNRRSRLPAGERIDLAGRVMLELYYN